MISPRNKYLQSATVLIKPIMAISNAASKNMAVIIMEPLRGGNLAKKPPPEVQKIWDTAAQKRPPVEWALRWIWNHPEVTVVLSGMNDEDHIRENLRIASEAEPDSLSEKELGLVADVAGVSIAWLLVPVLCVAALGLSVPVGHARLSRGEPASVGSGSAR